MKNCQSIEFILCNHVLNSHHQPISQPMLITLRPGSDADLFTSRFYYIELSTWKVRRLNHLGTPLYWAASSVYKNGLPGEGRHEGLVPRNDVLTNGFIGFSLARTLAQILFVPRLRPRQKPRRRCKPEEGYLHCSKRFDHRSHSKIFLLFEFKSVDDAGAGKLREMPTLHTNPHAVHGRFTLKDDCER